MNLLEEYPQIPHPARAVFKANGIPINTVAKALGLSYSYTSNMLCGVVKVTPENEAKLQELVKKVYVIRSTVE